MSALAVNLTLGTGKFTEHRLVVLVDSRDNLAFFPEHIDFGKIVRGGSIRQTIWSMIVAVPDQAQLAGDSAR